MLKAIFTVSAVIAITGCGSTAQQESPRPSKPARAASAPQRLGPDTELKVARSVMNSADYCLQYLKGTPSKRAISRHIAGVQELIAVYRHDPHAIYQPGGPETKKTMRQVLVDEAGSLQACASDDAARLDRVLRDG